MTEQELRTAIANAATAGDISAARLLRDELKRFLRAQAAGGALTTRRQAILALIVQYG